MTFLFAAIMIAVVAAIIAYPLLRTGEEAKVDAPHERRELLQREKKVALLAIKEAEFDRAMGKLSEEDYGSLRGLYERRALGALEALDSIAGDGSGDHVVDDGTAPAPDSVSQPRFCAACGRGFQQGDRFCAACGRPRPSPA